VLTVTGTVAVSTLLISTDSTRSTTSYAAHAHAHMKYMHTHLLVEVGSQYALVRGADVRAELANEQQASSPDAVQPLHCKHEEHVHVEGLGAPAHGAAGAQQQQH
jgi:hypothetical protein